MGPVMVLGLLLFTGLLARTQGRVVVNEFMAWSGCSANSEFVELLNFGPGPVNIGCFIVTNGQFAVTIPANTVLKPGQFFTLAGQDSLRPGCGNADSTVSVQLNWNRCGCITAPLPAGGDGFFRDGGSANEKVVLLDAAGRVVDAVSRSAAPSASALLATSGDCPSRTFDLDDMAVVYESINTSTGIDNSFARRVDGDCGWVKTTSISASAPNKTGSTSSATYSFTTVSASECAATAGRIAIDVSAPDVASLFPMSYTLAYDRDSNGVFDDTDHYMYGVDSLASSINISNLAYGRYRLTVASAMGCNLKNFDFFIFNCYGVVLPLKLQSFTYEGVRAGQHAFVARFSDADGLAGLHLEGAADAGFFQAVGSQYFSGAPGEKVVPLQAPLSPYQRYRLKVVKSDGAYYYSPVVKLPPPPSEEARSWPVPAMDRLFVSVRALRRGAVRYTVLGSAGDVLLKGSADLPAGASTLPLSVRMLEAGLYYLKLEGQVLDRPLMLRFVK